MYWTFAMQIAKENCFKAFDDQRSSSFLMFEIPHLGIAWSQQITGALRGDAAISASFWTDRTRRRWYEGPVSDKYVKYTLWGWQENERDVNDRFDVLWFFFIDVLPVDFGTFCLDSCCLRGHSHKSHTRRSKSHGQSAWLLRIIPDLRTKVTKPPIVIVMTHFGSGSTWFRRSWKC